MTSSIICFRLYGNLGWKVATAMVTARTALLVTVCMLLLAGQAAFGQMDSGYGGSRHGLGGGLPVAVRTFDAGGDGKWLSNLEFQVYASGPEVLNVRLYVLDGDFRALNIIEATLPMPRAGGWVKVPVPALQMPRKYGIGISTGCVSPEEITAANPATSYSWLSGRPAQPVPQGNWAIRTSVSDKPVPTPVAPDLVVLTSGESFFGKLEKMTPDPPTLHFAGHDPLPAVSVSAVYPNAVRVSSAGPMKAVVRLRDGQMVVGDLVSADDKVITLKVEGDTRQFRREEIERLEFQQGLEGESALYGGHY